MSKCCSPGECIAPTSQGGCETDADCPGSQVCTSENKCLDCSTLTTKGCTECLKHAHESGITINACKWEVYATVGKCVPDGTIAGHRAAESDNKLYVKDDLECTHQCERSKDEQCGDPKFMVCHGTECKNCDTVITPHDCVTCVNSPYECKWYTTENKCIRGGYDVVDPDNVVEKGKASDCPTV